ncbi:uncharacterized protein LOC124926821 [Impatiens glandulifera]|uniref:uncharacterized protein LOC124926821 n=1 Tax=Impatiens glandulifera TaxID=253017 RepID=UPI001FB0E10C|nr:uncharacterized protein LOC124926821 [Impatiens glandulifera]XP_047323087.1 uncharacterized protein LOC124926821 [Impatiens glandulifera]
MVVVEACKIGLSQSPSLSLLQVSSMIVDPYSSSLALMHPDSTFSLYPSLSPFSLTSPSLPPPQTLIRYHSAAAFVRLQSSNPNSTPRSVFVASGPHRGGASVHLNFWILRGSQSFIRTNIICNQKGLEFEGSKTGVVFNVNHGVSIKLVGSINVFAMYSVSNAKIWIFALKFVGGNDDDDDDDAVTLKLMKCAVVDCSMPVFTINISFGFLILGEENGVRVLNLRQLVEGGGRKQQSQQRKIYNAGLSLPNGLRLGSSVNQSKPLSSNGYLEGKVEKGGEHVKPKMVKLRQESSEAYISFVELKSKEVESNGSLKKTVTSSAKAISIQTLSSNKFLVLDSTGDLHMLCLPKSAHGSKLSCYVKPISYNIKVKKMAVLPDVTKGTRVVWVSDGHYTLHRVEVGSDPSDNESEEKEENKDEEGEQEDEDEEEEEVVQVSASQVIFNSEGIQDIVPFTTSSILVLGQGNIFAYAIN